MVKIYSIKYILFHSIKFSAVAKRNALDLFVLTEKVLQDSGKIKLQNNVYYMVPFKLECIYINL